MAILKHIICSSGVMKKCDNVHWSSKNVMKYAPKISEGLKYYMEVCGCKRISDEGRWVKMII
jgi:hypothetical protein